jgi:hypothetical protein
MDQGYGLAGKACSRRMMSWMVPGVAIVCWMEWKQLGDAGGSWRLEEKSVWVGTVRMRGQGLGSKRVDSNRQFKNKIR